MRCWRRRCVDRSWCHTVGYISPLAAGLALAGGRVGAAGRRRGGRARWSRPGSAPGRPRRRPPRAARLRPAADRRQRRRPHQRPRAHAQDRGGVPSADRDARPRDAAPRPPARHRPDHRGRARPVATAARRGPHGPRPDRAAGLRRIGIACAAITTDPDLADLAPAGVVAGPGGGRPAGRRGRAAGAAVPLQLLTLELAHARGTNPDLIRREQAPYREAAKIVEGG